MASTLVTAFFLLRRVGCNLAVLPQCGEFQIYGQFRQYISVDVSRSEQQLDPEDRIMAIAPGLELNGNVVAAAEVVVTHFAKRFVDESCIKQDAPQETKKPEMSIGEIDDILEKLRTSKPVRVSEKTEQRPEQHKYSNEILLKYGLTDLIV